MSRLETLICCALIIGGFIILAVWFPTPPQ